MPVNAPQPSTASSTERVSYCKKPGHEREEIEGACYQCADTFCKYCIEAHRDHYLIFFQDSYLKNNYSSVQQLQTGPGAEPPIYGMAAPSQAQ